MKQRVVVVSITAVHGCVEVVMCGWSGCRCGLMCRGHVTN